MKFHRVVSCVTAALLYCTVLIVASCSKTNFVESEPNNTIDTANIISPGKEMRGHLGTADDIDYYKLFISSPSILDIRLSEVRGINHSFSVWDSTGKTKILHVDDFRKSSPERACNVHIAGGYVYISVQHGDRDAPAANLENAYSLKIEVRNINPHEEIEPNNSTLQATPLRLDEEISGYFSPAFNRTDDAKGGIVREEDWFAIDVELPGSVPRLLDIELSPVDEIDSEIRLFSPAMKEIIGLNGKGPGKGESMQGICLTEQGKYYLVVSSVNFTSNFEKPYTLKLKTRTFDFRSETEPNEVPEHAQIIQTEEISGSFASRDDRDWFLLKKESTPHIARIEVSSAEDIDIAFNVYDSTLKKLFEVNAAPAGQREIVPNAGYSDDIFIEILPRGAVTTTGQHYKLSIATRPYAEGLEYEPNDTLKTATPICGNTITGYTSKKGDIDYYLLEFPSRAHKKLSASAVSSSKLKVSITDPRGHIIRTIMIPGGTEKRFYETLDTKGYLVVTSLSENYSEPYVIRIEDK